MGIIDLDQVIDGFFDDSSLCSEGQPEFVLFMGGVGCGKTTVRHQQYQKGYVHLDAAEIFAHFTHGQYYEFPSVFEEPLELTGLLIASRAVKEKRNIVTEVIGESLEDLEALKDAMNAVGYQVKLVYIECNIDEAYRRHREAVKKDANYVSAYYTQAFHFKWLLSAVEKMLAKK